MSNSELKLLWGPVISKPNRKKAGMKLMDIHGLVCATLYKAKSWKAEGQLLFVQYWTVVH